MAENKQKSETENKSNSEENKTGGAPTTAATSAKPAKENASTGNATDTAKGAVNQAKEAAGNAVEQAKDKAGSVLDEQKTNLASGVASVADSIRQVGENLGGSGENNQIAALAGKYGDNLAQQVERFSSYINEREIRELVTDVEKFARRNPIVFVGGAFVLGVFAARFLKSSGGRKRTANRS